MTKKYAILNNNLIAVFNEEKGIWDIMECTKSNLANVEARGFVLKDLNSLGEIDLPDIQMLVNNLMKENSDMRSKISILGVKREPEEHPIRADFGE
jgi:hypothetical protein